MQHLPADLIRAIAGDDPKLYNTLVRTSRAFGLVFDLSAMKAKFMGDMPCAACGYLLPTLSGIPHTGLYNHAWHKCNRDTYVTHRVNYGKWHGTTALSGLIVINPRSGLDVKITPGDLTIITGNYAGSQNTHYYVHMQHVVIGVHAKIITIRGSEAQWYYIHHDKKDGYVVDRAKLFARSSWGPRFEQNDIGEILKVLISNAVHSRYYFVDGSRAYMRVVKALDIINTTLATYSNNMTQLVADLVTSILRDVPCN